MNLKKVVITGLGILCPVGNSVPEFWNNIINGVSGADLITHFNAEKFKTKFACEVKNYDPFSYFDKKDVKKLDPSTQYALIAAEEAICDSGFLHSNTDKNSVGVILGTGIGGVTSIISELYDFYHGDGTPHFSPFFIPKVLPDMISGMISIKYGFKGPNYATTAACASAANAIIDACHYIQSGYSDIVISGGSEACIIEPVMGGFNSMHALSTRNEDFKTASRPFDLNRDGFVMGEGTAVLVLESYEHAIRRGAKIYAEIAGFGLSADATHITQPQQDGEGAIKSMKDAVISAHLQLNQIDYINTHGTSTPQGDLAECKAIETLFGEHAAKIAISATKSMTGHLLGASAAIEAAISILSIQNGIIPATINQFDEDTSLPKLGFIKNIAVKREVNVVISNSFGFGGHNTSILFKKI